MSAGNAKTPAISRAKAVPVSYLSVSWPRWAERSILDRAAGSDRRSGAERVAPATADPLSLKLNLPLFTRRRGGVVCFLS